MINTNANIKQYFDLHKLKGLFRMNLNKSEYKVGWSLLFHLVRVRPLNNVVSLSQYKYKTKPGPMQIKSVKIMLKY